MLTPGWADARTQWKNCRMSCRLQVELITEKEKEEEKEAIWSVWHCSKHHRTGTSSGFSFSGSGYFAKLLFGKAFFNNLSVPEHCSASSVCTPTSGIHGKLQADWGTASPFFKIRFLLICESHLYHSKVVVTAPPPTPTELPLMISPLQLGLYAACKDDGISGKTWLTPQLTIVILIHVTRRLIVVIKKLHQV